VEEGKHGGRGGGPDGSRRGVHAPDGDRRAARSHGPRGRGKAGAMTPPDRANRGATPGGLARPGGGRPGSRDGGYPAARFTAFVADRIDRGPAPGPVVRGRAIANRRSWCAGCRSPPCAPTTCFRSSAPSPWGTSPRTASPAWEDIPALVDWAARPPQIQERLTEESGRRPAGGAGGARPRGAHVRPPPVRGDAVPRRPVRGGGDGVAGAAVGGPARGGRREVSGVPSPDPRLGATLERLYVGTDFAARAAVDPVSYQRLYAGSADREVAALIAAPAGVRTRGGLPTGARPGCSRLADAACGPRAWVDGVRRAPGRGRSLAPIVYRWNGGTDFVLLLGRAATPVPDAERSRRPLPGGARGPRGPRVVGARPARRRPRRGRAISACPAFPAGCARCGARSDGGLRLQALEHVVAVDGAPGQPRAWTSGCGPTGTRRG